MEYLRKHDPYGATKVRVAEESKRISASIGNQTLAQPPHGYLPSIPIDQKLDEMIEMINKR